MASKRDIFDLTGPSHLTAIDWSNSHHRRSIAASLVEGVYTLEHDRRQNRDGPQALAPPWWNFFHFRLVQILTDKGSRFGAVFKFINFPVCGGQRPPQYVIAFRGTILEDGNFYQDIKYNRRVILNRLAKTPRFQIGLVTAHDFVERFGHENVWLAGHSLGSSLALIVGRQMTKQTGVGLETYLFNPPFPSAPIGQLSSDKLKLGLRAVKSAATAALVAAVNYGGNIDHEDDPFVLLSRWSPNLFVNPEDPICLEYIGYFKHREDMEAIGAGEIERVATKHSIRSIFLSAVGKKDCEAVHLLPSANLTVNVTPSQNFKENHGLHQWWRPDLQFRSNCYHYS